MTLARRKGLVDCGPMRSFLALLTVASVAVVSTPASAHQFLDYFDYGRAELSPLGYRTARDVARYAIGDNSRVRITAYVDTAEVHEFGDELALRRAQSMGAELVVLGLDPSRIEMRSGGIALAKPTPDNTREPLNRRLIVDVNY